MWGFSYVHQYLPYMYMLYREIWERDSILWLIYGKLVKNQSPQSVESRLTKWNCPFQKQLNSSIDLTQYSHFEKKKKKKISAKPSKRN